VERYWCHEPAPKSVRVAYCFGGLGPFFNRSHTEIFLYLDLKSTGICLRRFESCRRKHLRRIQVVIGG